MSNLTNSQSQVFEKFKKLKVGALFMEMGTGKTRVALELIKYNLSKIDLVLWLTPFSTIDNLKQEIEKWGGINKELIIMGYETLSMSTNKYLELLEKIKDKRLFIVADESIFIKNCNTKRYERLMNISKQSDYRLLLNGTPITKNEWDIYYQMNFLSDKIFDMNENEFLNTFFKKITYKKSDMRTPQTFYKLSDRNIEYLNALIEPYVFNVDFSFDKEIKTLYNFIDPTDETINANNNLIKTSIENILKTKNQDLIFSILTKLNYNSSVDENKINEIKSFIKDRKCICFCNFKEEINLISDKLECFVINGDTPQKERQKIIDNFKISNKPLIMSYGCGSYGLNLQFCNEIVFSSLTFDYSKILQAQARIKRLGQEQNIIYNYFILNTKINKLIFNNIDNKEKLEKEMLFFLEKEQNENIQQR